MTRIDEIIKFIDEKDKVIDVGCDMALLGRKLAKRGQKSIASDVSENVIRELNKIVSNLNLKDYIDVRLSNGLDNIKEREADTLVLAGMGTYTILDIIKRNKMFFNKIITISNNNHDFLRNEMNNLGYKIYKEKIVKERKKFYNLIIFIPGQYNYTEKELFLGINHIKDNLYKEYLTYLLNKYKKIEKKSEEKNKKINRYIEYLKEESKKEEI